MARAGAAEAASNPTLISVSRPGIGTDVWG
jgi:hypothetical protein